MMKKLGDTIKVFLFNNFLIKLLALAISFTLWFVVVVVDDPVDEKRFQNIRVNLVNTELLEEKNQIYEILDESDILKNVSFDAPKSVRDQIQSIDIVAEADLSNLTVTNTVEIKYSCPKYGLQVQNIKGNSDFVKLNIEDKAQKWLNITCNTVGQVAEGYVIGKTSLSQNRLRIQGPESAINLVESAVVDVNVEGISGDISASGNIRILDANGNEVVRASMTKNIDSVLVEVDILGTKEVPVEYEANGTAADGYAYTNVIVAPLNKVQIAGESKVLNRVSKIIVNGSAMDISGANQDVKKNIDLKDFLPDGVVFVNGTNSKTEVTIKIENYVNKTLSLNTGNLRVMNLPNGIISKWVDGSITPLEIRGLRANVDAVSENSIHGVVDLREYMESNGLTELTPGEYVIPVKLELGSDIQVVKSPSITVEIHSADEPNVAE